LPSVPLAHAPAHAGGIVTGNFTPEAEEATFKSDIHEERRSIVTGNIKGKFKGPRGSRIPRRGQRVLLLVTM